ncbi:hypothetical protein, partial [Pseudomonas edaphica]|uniref:hypothetical protein n=1 Tax=Pseudomonas edaphica TaxID=2006980 RepID=UPI00197F7A0B
PKPGAEFFQKEFQCPCWGLLSSPTQGKPARHNKWRTAGFVLTGSCVDTYAEIAVVQSANSVTDIPPSQASQLPHLVFVRS